MKGKTRTEEKVWSQGAKDGTGSGCSHVEAQPSWQQSYNSGCANRIDNDVAADADPRTGPAVYDSYPPSGQGLPKGWQQLGGTSASSPIIAAVYALANAGGTPPRDSRPARSPYLNASRACGTSRSARTGAAGRTCAPPGPATTARPGWVCPAA